MLIWNYNEDLSIGVRECRVVLDDEEIFEGIISQGNGLDCYFNYYTIITKNRDFEINREKLNMMLLKKLAP